MERILNVKIGLRRMSNKEYKDAIRVNRAPDKIINGKEEEWILNASGIYEKINWNKIFNQEYMGTYNAAPEEPTYITFEKVQQAERQLRKKLFEEEDNAIMNTGAIQLRKQKDGIWSMPLRLSRENK